MNQHRTDLIIEGSVAPGFESVKRLFEHNMATLAEENTQLCVYVGDDRVVDLWASASGNSAFTADSLVNVFSSGKSFEAIALASLVHAGRLSYETPIVDYWPEFGANGKDTLTVADLMRHEAGLAAFNTSLEPDDLLTENIKRNRVGGVIEQHPPRFPKGGRTRREYHAVTRGWIANEIFRRVEPDGRTIGEFLRDDIAGPLGADAMIGVDEQHLDRIVPVAPLGFGRQFGESLKPRAMGRKVERNLFQLVAHISRVVPAFRKGTTFRSPPPIEGMTSSTVFNEPAVVRGETPSANAHASARGLARIAAMMASRSQWEGAEYLSDAAWHDLHANPVAASMAFDTTFTQGGVARFSNVGANGSALDRALNVGREGYYGWFGLGGSIFQWHPEHRIGFGYVPTSLNILDFVNERGKGYQAEVLRCIAG